MDDRVDGVLLKHAAQTLCVTNVALIKGEVLTGQFLNAAERLRLGVVIVVHYHDIVSCIQHLNAGVTADVTAASGNQNSHILAP